MSTQVARTGEMALKPAGLGWAEAASVPSARYGVAGVVRARRVLDGELGG